MLQPGDEALLIEATRLLGEAEVSPARAASLLADPSYVMVVALSGGEVMGRIYGYILRRPESDDLLLYEVDVLERHRRKGAARAMVDFFYDLCRQRGYGEMWVLTEESNAIARALYSSSGGIVEGSPATMYVFPNRP